MTETIKEYFELLWTNLIVKKRNLTEYIKVVFCYYPNIAFARVDLSLLSKYFFKSPFSISKEFLIKKDAANPYAYGETPLTTLQKIADTCSITSHDIVFELGSGRGRGCFWLNSFIGCKVVGIEIIPEFVELAKQVKNKCSVNDVTFICGDILEADYSGATVLYLYGTCYEAPFIKRLISKILQLPIGTKVITVSYPLSDYAKNGLFEIVQCFPAQFTWGEADVFVQIKTI
jgi:SAM-dependent methyltransferase